MKRETLIGDFSTGAQKQSVIVETGYDRVRAACYSPELGIAIKRLRAAGDPQPGDWNNVILTLHKAVYQHFSRSKAMAHIDRANLCRMAVVEWYYPQCVSCKGAGQSWQVDEHGVKQKLLATCATCFGAGLRRFGDEERALLYKRRLDSLAEDVLITARNFLVDHENATDYNAAAALDRQIPEEYVK